MGDNTQRFLREQITQQSRSTIKPPAEANWARKNWRLNVDPARACISGDTAWEHAQT